MEISKEIVRGYKVLNSDWTSDRKSEDNGLKYHCPGVFETRGEFNVNQNCIVFSRHLFNAVLWDGFDPKFKVVEVVA